MKQFLLIVLIIFGISSAAYADTITLTYDDKDGNGDLTTTHSWATVETFDIDATTGGFTQAGWAGNGSGRFVTGSSSGQYAAPGLTDDTFYLSVPENLNDDPVYYDITFGGGTFNYFGLYWGSIDDYNTLSFYNGNVLVEDYTGDEIQDPANGIQSGDATNFYANFYFDTDVFNRVRLSSSRMAFEVDNLAVGTQPVPEPATMLLFGIGLLGLAGVSRRKK